MHSGHHLNLCQTIQKSKISFFNKRYCISHSCRNNVNFETDCRIDGCLAGEAALIVLDTVKALILTAKEIDVIQATLPKALEVLLHLLACNFNHGAPICYSTVYSRQGNILEYIL